MTTDGIGLRRLQHLVLWVSDVERSVRFYRDVLGFEVKVRYPNAAFLKIPGSPDDHHSGCSSSGRPAARRERRADVPLRVGGGELTDLVRARRRLTEAGALVGSSDHGVSLSLYAKDPDGIEFEVFWTVPEGKPAGTRPLHLEAELDPARDPRALRRPDRRRRRPRANTRETLTPSGAVPTLAPAVGRFRRPGPVIWARTPGRPVERGRTEALTPVGAARGGREWRSQARAAPSVARGSPAGSAAKRSTRWGRRRPRGPSPAATSAAVRDPHRRRRLQALFIVARGHPELLDQLRVVMGHESGVKIIEDRQHPGEETEERRGRSGSAFARKARRPGLAGEAPPAASRLGLAGVPR